MAHSQFNPGAIAGAIAGVVVEPVTVHHDERGWLCETFRSDASETPAMGYVSMTKPGVARGPHEHRDQTDRFCFPGPSSFEVWLWDNRAASPTFGVAMHLVVGESFPCRMDVPPGVVHAYRNVGLCDGLVVNTPDRLYRGQNRSDPPDEIRHEDDPDSPFRLP